MTSQAPAPADPDRRRRLRRHVHRAAAAAEAARRARRRSSSSTRSSYMTYQPFLPEAGAGHRGAAARRRPAAPGAEKLPRPQRRGHPVEPRRAAGRGSQPIEGPPLRAVLRRPRHVSRLDRPHAAHPGPGRARASGFKTVGEAIYLRNHVLARLDAAASTTDPDIRPRALTFVFVGGGYAGHRGVGRARGHGPRTPARTTTRDFEPADMRWVLVEATGRILPEVDGVMGALHGGAAAPPRDRRAAEHPAESSPSAVTSSWTTARSSTPTPSCGPPGSGRNPMLQSDRPAAGRQAPAEVRRLLQVDGVEAPGRPATARPSPTCHEERAGRDNRAVAQHAVRQAKQLADNIVADINGRTDAAVPAQVRRVGRLARPAQGRRPDLRRQAARAAGLVHAPHVPRRAGCRPSTARPG